MTTGMNAAVSAGATITPTAPATATPRVSSPLSGRTKPATDPRLLTPVDA